MSGIYRAEFPRVWQTELTRVADGAHACGRRSSRVRQTEFTRAADRGSRVRQTGVYSLLMTYSAR